MKKLLLITCGLAIAAAVEAQVIHVPADYSTIQQGIDAANNGDTVLVSDGTYYEQINFKGKKPLMVASQFLFDNDTNHIYNTILDGQQLTNLDSASVVYFVSGEDTTSILCGFTVRNGKGTYTTDNYNDRQGGGIWISNAGAKIIHNRITHNTVDDTQPGNGESASGGGIGAKFGIGNYWIVIADNTIDSNSCISTNEYATGGGISLSYNARIINNIISHNTTRGYQSAQVWGGGMYLAQSTGWPSGMAIIESNTIISNNTEGLVNTCAAGLECDNMKIIFSDNLVAENIINPGGSGGGAGFLLYQPEEGSIISNNIFKKNKSNLWIGGGVLVQTNSVAAKIVLVENNYFIDNRAPVGGAFGILNNPVLFQNNVFSGNQAGNSGGALHLSNSLNLPYDHIATIINCAFFDNGATINGGAMYSYNTKPLIFNSIFWCDSANNGQEIFTSINDTVEIAYSNINPGFIYGNFYDGSGNINENPLFEDLELLTISENSPCINTGTAEYICHCNHLHTAPAYDILGTLRPLNDNFEMGAYEKLTTQGQIIHVPADYPTIQQGIDAANNGDTVLVADGIYYEQINFLGKKPLVVASEFINDGDTNHIVSTIIDGSQPVHPDLGSVVSMVSNEDTTSVLCGFTIKGGTGTIIGGSSRVGGGIFIQNSGGKLLNNYIEYNIISNTGWTVGGGVVATGQITPIPWVVLKGNRISHNKAVSTNGEGGGGGIENYYNLILIDNQISHNEAEGRYKGDGGGIRITGSYGLIALDIRHNIITYNKAISVSDVTSEVISGGIDIAINCSGIVTNNVISFNEIEVAENKLGYASGVLVQSIMVDDFVFGNNMITDNSYEGNICLGGGILIYSSKGNFLNNVVQNNIGSEGGGIAIANSGNNKAILINNNITGNEGNIGGGLYLTSANAVVINTIIWGNTATEGASIFTQTSTLEVRYSDVQGDDLWPGEGNLNCTPNFLADGYHLDVSCQLVNSGIASIEINGIWYTCPAYDIDGDVRPYASTQPEIGVDEVDFATLIRPVSASSMSMSIYPNPADQVVTISLQDDAIIKEVILYNQVGQNVYRGLPDDNTLDVSKLQPGVYLIEVITNQSEIRGKLIIE